MLMPKDFNEVQAYTGFTPLEPGGHILVIKKVEETTSKTGNKPMINIYFDTDKTDSQPEYFTQQYKSNSNPNKKWSNNATIRQLVLDAEGATNRGFKTFIEMVEKSNNGFKVQWGDNFCNCFKGKLVGGVFGREEYEKDGAYKFATKHQSFRTVEDIKNGVEVPADKLLNPSGHNNSNAPDFGDMIPVEDMGKMPF